MEIKLDKDAINFLYYLATIKQFDGLSIVRVVERPDLMDKMYDNYVEDTNNG